MTPTLYRREAVGYTPQTTLALVVNPLPKSPPRKKCKYVSLQYAGPRHDPIDPNRVTSLLTRQPGLTPNEMCRVLNVARCNLGHMLARLVKSEVLTKEPHPTAKNGVCYFASKVAPVIPNQTDVLRRYLATYPEITAQKLEAMTGIDMVAWRLRRLVIQGEVVAFKGPSECLKHQVNYYSLSTPK